MSMKVTGNSQFHLPITGKMDSNPKKIGEQIKTDQPIKVDISKEAMSKYRASVQAKAGDSNRILDRHEELSNQIQSQIKLNFEMGSRLTTFTSGENEQHSAKEQSQDLLNVYASMYDEIVTGYENNSRERYTEDDSVEGGYRKLTMAEELDELDDSYKKYSNFIESIEKQRNEIAPSFEEYTKQLEKIGSLKRTAVVNRMADTFSKREKLPDNVSGKLWDASRTFVQQYSDPTIRAKGLDTLLKGIKIF